MQAKNKTFMQMYEDADAIETVTLPANRCSDTISISIGSITDVLISETGRICKHHASDLLIDLNCLNEIIVRHVNNKDVLPPELHIFGFREMGVDHDTYVRYNINERKDLAQYYPKVLAVCVEDVQDENYKDVYITLKDITQSVIS